MKTLQSRRDSRGRCAVVLALLVLAGSSSDREGRAQSPTARSEIRDSARLFGPSALSKAAGELAAIERRDHLTTRIETVDSLKGEPVADASLRLAGQMKMEGLHILIAKEEHKLHLRVSNLLIPVFPEAKLVPIRDAFIAGLRDNDPDKGLLLGVEEIGKVAATLRLPASAHPTAPVTALVARNQARLNLAGARLIIEAAEAKAAELKLKVNIAVVDDGGHLLAFARMDGARPASGYTAHTKATTAATFRQETGPLPKGAATPDLLLNLSLQNAATASGGKLTTLLGGIPVVLDDQVIGAIGVGGGTGEQDAQVARAGVDAFRAALKSAPATLDPGKAPEDVIPL